MADLSPELAAQLKALESSYAENPGRYFVPYAGLLREAGQPGQAEEILRENLKRFPGLSAHVLLGRCLADRGAYQEASNEFHYVLSIDAQNLIALRTLAEMAAAQGRSAEARRWYDELLAVDPMNADARSAMGRLAGAGADAATADQPAASDDAWGGAGEAAGAAPPAGDGADLEWGDLDLGAAAPPAEDRAPAAEFDAFGFGEVELGGGGAPAAGDEARQDPGEAAGADFPLLDFGSEAEEEEEEEEGAPEPPPPAGEEPEVVTETMAELYASQGLVGRAAEVYRELIQRRGEEPGLVRRLAELEAPAAPRPPEPEAETPDWLLRVDEESAAPGSALPSLGLDAGLPDLGLRGVEEEPASGASGDEFAASVSDGFGAEALPVQPPAAERGGWEPPEVVETAEGPGFDLLVVDESVELDGDAHPPASAEEAAELSADWAVAAAPLEEQEAEPVPAPASPRARTMRGYFDALLTWGSSPEPEPAGEAPAPVAEDAPRAAPVEDAFGGPEVEPEEPLPWELPADASAGDAPPAAEAPAGGGGFSFEEFFTAEPEPEAEPEPVPVPPSPGAEAPPAPAGTEAAGAAPAGGEDEDLESFQAWLQSLKR